MIRSYAGAENADLPSSVCMALLAAAPKLLNKMQHQIIIRDYLLTFVNILAFLHIPTQTGHRIRMNLDTDSEARWTVDPTESGHRIRRKLDTFLLDLGLRPGSFPQSGDAG